MYAANNETTGGTLLVVLILVIVTIITPVIVFVIVRLPVTISPGLGASVGAGGAVQRRGLAQAQRGSLSWLRHAVLAPVLIIAISCLQPLLLQAQVQSSCAPYPTLQQHIQDLRCSISTGPIHASHLVVRNSIYYWNKRL